MLLLQALLHAMKVAAWPGDASARHWRNEIDTFLETAGRRFTPSMTRNIDVPDLHRAARRLVLRLDMRRPPRPLAETTDLTLADLLAEDAAPEALVTRVAGR